MAQQTSLGPRLQRYRTRVPILAAIGWLSVGPLIILVTLGVAGVWRLPELLLVTLIGVIITAAMAAYLLWSGSAHLDVHAGGVVVGRSILAGRPRELRFTEIHPATLRVHTGIDSLQPTWDRRFRRPSSAHLFLGPGADHAVSFLGPDRDSELSGTARPPVPGRGIIVFASPAAEEIADQLRAGLERAGCPPPLAREYLRHGVRKLPGNGLRARQEIPGMEYR
ncbi:MAG: hypothetical protein ACTIJK_05060 [Brachybacterium sp.]